VAKRRISKAPDERRQELLDAARDLFVEKGYEQTSVSDVVAKVGVAQGTFYWYFQSKEEVLLAIMREVGTFWVRMLTEVAQLADLNAVQKLKAMEQQVVAGIMASPQLIQTIHLRANMPVHARLAEEMVPAMLPPLVAIVEQGRSEGLFQVRSPETAAFLVLQLAEARFDALTRSAGRSTPSPEAYLTFWEFLLRGLGVPEARVAACLAEMSPA